jgi:hypothetical protein
MSFSPTQTPPHAMTARSPNEVDVFMGGPPKQDYVEVGFFEIEQDNSMSGGTDVMVRKLREKAGSIGCEGIIVGAPADRPQMFVGNTYKTGGYGATTVGNSTSVRSYRAACIVYSKDPVES